MLYFLQFSHKELERPILFRRNKLKPNNHFSETFIKNMMLNLLFRIQVTLSPNIMALSNSVWFSFSNKTLCRCDLTYSKTDSKAWCLYTTSPGIFLGNYISKCLDTNEILLQQEAQSLDCRVNCVEVLCQFFKKFHRSWEPVKTLHVTKFSII